MRLTGLGNRKNIATVTCFINLNPAKPRSPCDICVTEGYLGNSFVKEKVCFFGVSLTLFLVAYGLPSYVHTSFITPKLVILSSVFSLPLVVTVNQTLPNAIIRGSDLTRSGALDQYTRSGAPLNQRSAPHIRAIILIRIFHG